MFAEYELIKLFGDLCSPLTRSEAGAADFESRVGSIGRYLVREVQRSYKRLSPEGKITYDPEDLLLECWIKLRERDDKYESGRGDYLVFARRIIHNRLTELTEKTRCVGLPANSAGQFRTLQGAEDQESQNRLSLLVRTARDHVELHQDAMGAKLEWIHTPLQNLIDEEEDQEGRDQLAAMLVGELTLLECLALGAYYGLWSNPRKALKDLAREYSFTTQQLRKALASARVKIKSAVEVSSL